MRAYRALAYRTAFVAGLSLFSGVASALSFGVGPLGGLNLGGSSFDAPSGMTMKSEMRSGLALGARAELGVTKPYSLLLEPMYLQRADVETMDMLGLSFKSEVQTNYLELPVLAKAKFGAMKAHAYVFAGPSLGIFLNGESKTGGVTKDVDSVSTLNVSGEVGACGSYQVQKFVYLNLDARYAYGFTNANDKNDKITWKHQDIRIMACVLFHLTE